MIRFVIFALSILVAALSGCSLAWNNFEWTEDPEIKEFSHGKLQYMKEIDPGERVLDVATDTWIDIQAEVTYKHRDLYSYVVHIRWTPRGESTPEHVCMQSALTTDRDRIFELIDSANKTRILIQQSRTGNPTKVEFKERQINLMVGSTEAYDAEAIVTSILTSHRVLETMFRGLFSPFKAWTSFNGTRHRWIRLLHDVPTLRDDLEVLATQQKAVEARAL